MLWKESKHRDAQELITWLLASKPAANAWDMDRSVMIGLVELAYSTSDPMMTDYLVMQILNRMYEEKQNSVEDFEAHYTQLKRDRAHAERMGQADWAFYIPLEIRLPAGTRVRTLKFLGQTIDLLPENSALRQLPLGSAIKNAGRHFVVDVGELRNIVGQGIDYQPGAFLRIRGTGADLDTAWEDVEPVFSALRGFIEFTFGLGSARIAGLEKPRAKVPHPNWVLAVGTDGLLQGFAFETEDERRAFPLEMTKERWRVLRRNTEILTTEPHKGSIQSVITDCLRLYAQAMDARFSYSCFLGFWQLGEAITLSETVGGQTDKVAERLAWHHSKLELPGTGYTATLRRLGQKRNHIVHRGIHDVGDEDVNILKLSCDVALLWIMRERASFPTIHHLDQFYRIREANKSVLDGLKGAIALVEKERTT